MATASFSTSVLTFVTLWLYGLTAFGIIVCAVFLHILGAVDGTIGSSVAVSIISAAFTFVHLVLQSVNVSRLQQRHWHKSWLSSTCVQLPRVSIVVWIVTTTIGLVVALRQPLCKNGDVKTDATAWQAGLGCWMFRALVSLNVVMLILSFSNFIMLETNGRYVPIGLLHFEYAPSETDQRTQRQNRRRTLVASAYGDSVVSLASPMTISSEDEQNLTGATEKYGPMRLGRDSPISPSPTYRTFDLALARSRAPTLSTTPLRPLSEESIIELSSSRQSSCTTTTMSTVPLSQFPATPSAGKLTSSQLQSRSLSVSGLPVVPTSFQRQLKELEDLKAGNIPVPLSPGRAALYNITNTSANRMKSSCALPLSHPSSTTLGARTSTNVPELSEEKSGQPLSETVETPPPAWCPKDLKGMPLSADPAIRRLTELRRNSKLGLDRKSRRFSHNGFDFGFGGRDRSQKKQAQDSVDRENVIDSDKKLGNLERQANTEADLFADPVEDTPTKKPAIKPEASKAGAGITDNGKSVAPSTRYTRKHDSKSSKRPQKNLSIMPPPTNTDKASHDNDDRSRRRGKSMVERGRYEKLPR